MPQPSFDALRQNYEKLKRHLHEPPRKRKYQRVKFLC
jgi:hypothetical protein